MQYRIIPPAVGSVVLAIAGFSRPAAAQAASAAAAIPAAEAFLDAAIVKRTFAGGTQPLHRPFR